MLGSPTAAPNGPPWPWLPSQLDGTGTLTGKLALNKPRPYSGSSNTTNFSNCVESSSTYCRFHFLRWLPGRQKVVAGDPPGAARESAASESIDISLLIIYCGLRVVSLTIDNIAAVYYTTLLIYHSVSNISYICMIMMLGDPIVTVTVAPGRAAALAVILINLRHYILKSHIAPWHNIHISGAMVELSSQQRLRTVTVAQADTQALRLAT